jgi:hypothetical protein
MYSIAFGLFLGFERDYLSVGRFEVISKLIGELIALVKAVSDFLSMASLRLSLCVALRYQILE